MKILFLYPNHGTELRIPLAISIIISAIRTAGHDVKLFDTTFMGKFYTDNELMAKMGTHKATNLEELVGKTSKGKPKVELDEMIASYKPDLICVSLVERNFNEAKNLLHDVDVPVLAGGIMPSIAPDFCIDQDWIDYICVGEGELAIVDFLNANPELSQNIWSKGKTNKLRPLIHMDNVPNQDWCDFDERHLLKPFMGKVYRGGAFELSRGCNASCTFCVAPKLRKMSDGLGCYHRTKSPEHSIHEIEDKVKKYNLSMLSFGDTDFLAGVPKSIMKEFLDIYANKIKVPFTIQASVRTLLDEEILKMLRKAQCCAISVGVESGSHKIQAEVIKKVIPRDMIKRAFDMCRANELRVTANYMIGLPFETEADVNQTIDLNKLINPPSIAVTFFTPYIGTELYDVCLKHNFYKPFKENIYEYPPLEMPQFKQERIMEMVKEFIDRFKEHQQDFNILGDING